MMQTTRIGGPGTLLPRCVESFLSWTLATGCLAVSYYHYLRATFVSPALYWCRRQFVGSDDTSFPCWLPLTTASRSEEAAKTCMERLKELEQLLQKETGKQSPWSDSELVTILRSSCTARRLATLAMRPTTTADNNDASSTHQTLLGRQLVKLWSALLVLPPPTLANSQEYEISLVLPAFKEQGIDVKRKLQKALESCQNPKTIQVLVVDAGECIELSQHVETLQGWGQLVVLNFTDGGGRGPCLNFGAHYATGRVYTFCHSDTTLPSNWDTKIISALTPTTSSKRPNSCCFQFGIDVSGLNNGGPPGIRAVERKANVRTRLHSLPYGDQVLSIPAVVFDYIGGFPDQCLMEDYELVSLLRRRAALLPKFGTLQTREELVVIGGEPALCSARRWQQFGVLYVTYMNSKFVYLYSRGMSDSDLFELYYKRPPPQRSSPLAPWEIEWNLMLENKTEK